MPHHLFKLGDENMIRYVQITKCYPEGIHILTVNMLGVWWDVMIPHFTVFKITIYLSIYQMRHSRSISFNSIRMSVQSIISFHYHRKSSRDMSLYYYKQAV